MSPTQCSNDFKNKDDIKAALSSVPLGPATVKEEDADQQVLRDLALCEYFSVQSDESPDVTYTARLIVFVRMVFHDSTTNFLTVLHLKDRTRGEDILNQFNKHVLVPIIKLVAVTTDGPQRCAVCAWG